MAGDASLSGPALLAARFPRLAARLPRLSLGAWPTPLATVPSLAGAVGCPALLVKDDSLAAPGYGGNKVRKLEHLLADARARGCDAVVTFGAVGSNHVLATALHASALGLHCHAVLTDQPPSPRVADTLRWHALLGTTLHTAEGLAGSRATATAIRAAHPGGPDAIAEIPWGGSSPLGAIGFVAAGLELAAQLAMDGQRPPQAIYLPLGTMGTVAGLALGLRLAGLTTTRIVAVQVVPPVVASRDGLAVLVTAANALMTQLDPAVPLLDDPLASIDHRTDCFGGGYAVATPAAARAVALAAEAGLALETTYSGKALAALIADAPRLDPSRGPVIFWVTCNRQPKPAGLADVDTRAIPTALRRYLA
jgi:1-aminocyclopropane-1-carboxylate deaminase/D-cysteine desulfhydrase-like pyridoxal-dependent ACC family enzyme